MRRSLVLISFIFFYQSVCFAIADSIVAKTNAYSKSRKVQKIRFAATVDTAIIVSVRDEEVLKPRFACSRESLAGLTDSSVIVVGYDSHWLLKCRNVKIVKNVIPILFLMIIAENVR